MQGIARQIDGTPKAYKGEVEAPAETQHRSRFMSRQEPRPPKIYKRLAIDLPARRTHCC